MVGRSFGGTQNDGHKVTVVPSGVVVFGGLYDSYSIVQGPTLVSAGGQDALVALLSP